MTSSMRAEVTKPVREEKLEPANMGRFFNVMCRFGWDL